MDKNVAKKIDISLLKKDIKEDIGEVLDLMKIFMAQADERFNKAELSINELKQDTQNILNHLDSIEKDLSINDDERAVIGMQLTRMHDWIEKAASKIDIQFTH